MLRCSLSSDVLTSLCPTPITRTSKLRTPFRPERGKQRTSRVSSPKHTASVYALFSATLINLRKPRSFRAFILILVVFKLDQRYFATVPPAESLTRTVLGDFTPEGLHKIQQASITMYPAANSVRACCAHLSPLLHQHAPRVVVAPCSAKGGNKKGGVQVEQRRGWVGRYGGGGWNRATRECLVGTETAKLGKTLESAHAYSVVCAVRIGGGSYCIHQRPQHGSSRSPRTGSGEVRIGRQAKKLWYENKYFNGQTCNEM